MVQLEQDEGAVVLRLAGRTILRHGPNSPAISVASGAPQVAMVRGNFRLSDTPVAASPLCRAEVNRDGSAVLASDDGSARVTATLDGARLTLAANAPHDRITITFALAANDVLWGGGEQMSYLVLNGRNFPIWTSEPGVGREPGTPLTDQASADGS
ncbi:MAG: alpha-glucosidase, partial [Erythrobacter sp.]